MQLSPDNMGVMFNWYSFSLFAAAEHLRLSKPAHQNLDHAAELMARMDGVRADWITPCPRAEYHLRRGVWLLVQARERDAGAALDQAGSLLDAALAQQPDDVDCARRKLELGAVRLGLRAAGAKHPELVLAGARPLQQRHAGNPQVRLAWLELQAAALPGLSQPHRDETAVALRQGISMLRELTGAAWHARLQPVETAIPR